MIISTSWDDGHQLDMRLGELLSKYNLTGTFYIAKDYLSERMSDDELRQLSQAHELGAHTLTHPVLTEIPLEDARQEIVQSKQWLEDVLGKPVTSFCYPKGAQNESLQKIAEQADYQMARGVSGYHLHPNNRFNMQTTIHIYPFPLRPLPGYPLWRGIRTRLQPLSNALPYLRDLHVPYTSLYSWESLATALLEKAAEQNSIWHLWGHSWEIEKFGMWDALESVLRTASSYQAQTLNNTQLATHIWGQNP